LERFARHKHSSLFTNYRRNNFYDFGPLRLHNKTFQQRDRNKLECFQMTEIYTLPKSSSVPGPDLPYAVADAALVEDGHGGVVLVGGTDGAKELSSLYRLEHAGNGTSWCLPHIKLLRP
jgi:hypothetical protein